MPFTLTDPGAAIAGITGFAGALLVQFLATRSERKRLELHNQNADADRRAREAEFIATNQRSDKEWRRQELHDAYSGAFYYLVKLALSSLHATTRDKDVRQHFSEAQRYLILLDAHHEVHATKEKLRARREALADNSDQTAELSCAAEQALEEVKIIFGEDTRLQMTAPLPSRHQVRHNAGEKRSEHES